jgi:short-subunit dehydrogenase
LSNIIIIGATSGIGYALAEAYLRAGWKVGATGRRLEALEPLHALAPDRAFVRRHDTTAPDSIATLENLVAEMGGADVLVYNSGVGIYNKNMDWEPERDTIAVNVTGFTEVAAWAYRYFRERGGGHLVGVSSIAGLRGGRTAPAYHASKAFMSNYMDGLRQKAWHHQMPMYITDIRPGFVDTPMTQQNRNMFWVATPQRAARQIMSAIARRAETAYITRRWALVAALFKLAPNWLYKRLMG